MLHTSPMPGGAPPCSSSPTPTSAATQEAQVTELTPLPLKPASKGTTWGRQGAGSRVGAVPGIPAGAGHGQGGRPERGQIPRPPACHTKQSRLPKYKQRAQRQLRTKGSSPKTRW